MRNRILIMIGILIFATSIYAQSYNENPFSGKVFKIDNFIDGKFDNTEDLTFSETKVEGSICVRYGFEAANYTISKNDSGKWEFHTTMISHEHGKMVWTGEKNGTKIKGKYLWTKDGQNPINYTFEGELKSPNAE